MELFPAIMVGGPPHSGKSVLVYSLTQVLRKQDVAHYVLRAYPDGEGDWANETDQTLVRRIRVKGDGTPQWIDHICRDIANRHLPLIVDVGGRPTQWQEAVFDHCTHAILLTPHEVAQTEWKELVAKHGLSVLAVLHSILAGDDFVQGTHPILQGQISRLERGQMAQGPVFEALVDLLGNLFAYDEVELRNAHLSLAPTELVVELSRIGQTLGLGDDWHRWLPEHLPILLDYLPDKTPIGLYDRGPNWLYAALTLHVDPAQLYQFDVRLGWVIPPALTISPTLSTSVLNTRLVNHKTYTWLEVTLTKSYLDYNEAKGLPVPPLPPDQGVILSGKLPLWLWTALTLAYRNAPWIAIFQPQLDSQAIVIASQDESKSIGNLIALSDLG